MLPDVLVYVERYHWTLTTVSALALCCGFALLAIAVPQMPLLARDRRRVLCVNGI